MRILIVNGYGYWGNFDPRAAYREIEGADYQIGGGETAMVSISHELSLLGHEVMVFYGTLSGQYDGVDYVQPSYAMPLANELWHDALIAWDLTDFFRFYTRSGIRVAAYQLNDARVGVYDHLVDLYPCPSEWHAKRFKELYPEITASKQRPTITNGVSPELYQPTKDPNGNVVEYVPRQQYRVIYSSSPDRGLHHLLAIWPEVKSVVPHAELHVFYDIEKWFGMLENCIQHNLRANTEPRYHEIKALLGELNRQGMGPILHGGVSKAELARAQLSSHVQAYPCDPVQPTEGFSMTCLEGLMAGCHLVTTDADALGELWTEFEVAHEGDDMLGPSQVIPLPLDREAYATALIDALKRDPYPDGPSDDPRLQKYFWSNLGKTWEKELLSCLVSKQSSK
jgi:glycosyltransferase involved in cell wall biosynthesis